MSLAPQIFVSYPQNFDPTIGVFFQQILYGSRQVLCESHSRFLSPTTNGLLGLFFAAWHVQVAGGDPSTVVLQMAAALNVNPKYLATVRDVLTDMHNEIGPIQILRSLWRDLPADIDRQQEAREGCERIAAYIKTLRRRLEPVVEGINIDGIHNGAQSFVLWKNDQYAANRRRYDSNATIDVPDAFYISERGRDYVGVVREQHKMASRW